MTKSTVLIVDDSPENLGLLGGVLADEYAVRAANTAEKGLRAARIDPIPDLILLDVMMPEINGYEAIKLLKADPLTEDIPVIFVTSMNTNEDEQQGLALGAVDYITKPINSSIVKARVRNHIELKRARDRLSLQNNFLEEEVARRVTENEMVRDLSVRALAVLAEERDNETGLHIIRTQTYVRILGEYLRDIEPYRSYFQQTPLADVVRAAPLHDIGKVGIPDAILLKPGRLTEQEFEVMKRHAKIGGDAINRAVELVVSGENRTAEPYTGDAFDFLYVARDIALYHHERWDGTGYPEKLSGDDIPVAARLMAVADVFDAITSRRVYKDAIGFERAYQIILDGKGSHFDPGVVDAFVACKTPFFQIAEQFADDISNAS